MIIVALLLLALSVTALADEVEYQMSEHPSHVYPPIDLTYVFLVIVAFVNLVCTCFILLSK